jgi:hypothetical protein
MMDIAIQVPNLPFLMEALTSTCQRVRFGSEFCMYALPSLDILEKAYGLTNNAGKDFVYVTPRLSDSAMNTIRKHLLLLSDLGGATIIVNDLGTIRILREFSSLKAHLGRQLVYTPSRSPWKTITEHPVNFLIERKVREIFYQTSLNYKPTIEFFKRLGAVGVDVDWIPELFPNLSFISRNKLQISVNLHSIPVAITRKCHMARFLGEENLDTCSRPCYTKAYFMDNELLDTDLYLNGNTVFRLKEPTKKMISTLTEVGVKELVLTLNPLTNASLQIPLESFIQQLQE